MRCFIIGRVVNHDSSFRARIFFIFLFVETMIDKECNYPVGRVSVVQATRVLLDALSTFAEATVAKELGPN